MIEKIKNISWQWLVMVGMGAAILILLFFPKSCGVDKLEEKIKRYESYIPRKQAEAKEFRTKALKLEKKVKDDSLKNLESERKYLAKITALEKKVAEKRRIAAPIIQKNDTVRQLVEALEAENSLQSLRINELKEEARIQGLVFRDLYGARTKELGVIKEIDVDKEVIIASQAKEIRKLKAGRTLRNILLPAAAVGAFMLGVMASD